jgi:hypothetical protein
MSRNFNLDTAAAKEASNGGKRITDAGAYVGIFRAAWYEKNERGTESVSFIFVSDGGQEVGPLSLYTHNADGDELPSYKTLNAILACMKVRSIEGQKGKVKLWDFDEQQEVERAKEIYPALICKKIGVVLQGEEYEGRNGVKVRMILAAPFEPSTRLMADEILNKQTEAKGLDRYIAWIEKNPVKKLRNKKSSNGNGNGGGYTNGGTTSGTPASTFEDDDIPF